MSSSTRASDPSHAAGLLAGDERDLEPLGLPEQRPEQWTLEVVEVDPVALARESRQRPGGVECGELEEPRVLLRREPEPVLRVGQRAPGQLPPDPVAGVAPVTGRTPSRTVRDAAAATDRPHAPARRSAP